VSDTPTASRAAAQDFATQYASARSEKQLAQSFWRDLLSGVAGVSDLLASGVEFEYPVRLANTGRIGWIDMLWPQVVLVEHKSAGSDLDKAEAEARLYLQSLEPALRPPVLVVSDFQTFRVIEVLAGQSAEFALADLPDNLERFDAVIGSRGRGAASVEIAADAAAAELMSRLFVAFEEAGYGGHEVSVFLVRVLFLLFGDDTGMWRRSGERGLFGAVVESSQPDGTGLGGTIQELFQLLNTPRDKRPTTIPPSLSDFPYANGGLFSESLPVFSFTPEMRHALLEASAYDWSGISPAIFGAMFQNIKSREARRELGQHFTSEANILKVIGPLFLTEFYERLAKEWDSPPGLRRFKRELGTYTFADPACGCGNFLLVAYKRLRELDLRLTARLQELAGKDMEESLYGPMALSVRLSQFFGIEIDEWSSQIASVAMFLAEHQANRATERLLGEAPDLLPLEDSASITTGNALLMDWSALFPLGERTLIMGNPPFTGARVMTREQKEDTRQVWGNETGAGNLDYVANWYRVAANHAHTGVRTAFVSTNSIAQGEQPPVLWGRLQAMGLAIDFAHQTFRWDNDAYGMAAVHCVIEGFSKRARKPPLSLWTYASPASEPQLVLADNINAYLANAPDVLVTSRSAPLNPILQPLTYGSQPNDSGWLSDINPEQAEDIRTKDPTAAKYLRRVIGARELLHGDERWCLWLVDAPPEDLRRSPELARRLDEVAKARLSSNREATRALANTPGLFGFINPQKAPYLAVPLHSSELRPYLPMALFDPDVITTNALSVISDASTLSFGLMSSRIFWVWAGAVSGRLESRLRISGRITYNNFPLPEVSPAAQEAIEQGADAVLIARSHFLSSTLADLYDANAMPPQLRRAHQQLDGAVASVFGLRGDSSDEVILSRLFRLYAEMTGGLFPEPVPTPQRGRARRAA
jgi:hypothetical protein